MGGGEEERGGELSVFTVCTHTLHTRMHTLPFPPAHNPSHTRLFTHLVHTISRQSNGKLGIKYNIINVKNKKRTSNEYSVRVLILVRATVGTKKNLRKTLTKCKLQMHTLLYNK